MNELVLARALLRTGLILLAVVGVVLLGLELKWVVAQVFAAAIVAAGMAPIVTRLTDPRRTRSYRWRPPAALGVVLIYVLVGLGRFRARQRSTASRSHPGRAAGAAGAGVRPEGAGL
jgi:hypothetical protein